MINDELLDTEHRWKYVYDSTIVAAINNTCPDPSAIQRTFDNLLAWTTANRVTINHQNSVVMQQFILPKLPRLVPIPHHPPATTQEAVPQEPAGNGPRIAGGLWLLSAFILGVVYRGNLKAMLILPKVVLPFDTLQELTETNIPIWIPEGNLVHKAIMAATPDSAYYRLRKQMLVHLDVPRGTRETFGGLHAVAAPMTTIVFLIDLTFSTASYCLFPFSLEAAILLLF
ncbi:uncharacterized protein LOC134765757 [Penaeus indicus]|uniref:uncharacterized protein LOC134765757 n=1 Tax=Penaeus indicus TaxID=29960 RepID=UPI00300CD36B